MKQILLSLVIILLISQAIYAKKARSNKKLHQMHHSHHANQAHSTHHQTHHLKKSSSKDILVETPKGRDLDNHYGYHPHASPYGINYGPYKAHHTILADNTHIATVSVPVKVTPLSSCQIEQDVHYKFCFSLNSCDLCSASPYCGWCGARQQCLPGTLKAATCPNMCTVSQFWVFETSQCSKCSQVKVASGYMTNVHPTEATKLVNAEITNPKARIRTTIHHPAVVKTPVLLGHVHHHHDVTHVNSITGEVSKQQVHIEKPIVGEVHQVMNVETTHEQVVDLKTGQRLDQPQQVKFHGVNIPNQ